MRTTQLALGAMLAGVCALTSAGDARASDFWRNNSSYESERNSELVLHNLCPILEKFGLSGRIYYIGACTPDHPDFPPTFPELTLRSKSETSVGVDAAKDIFSGDPNVEVSGDRTGGV